MYSLMMDTSTNEIALGVYRDKETVFEDYIPAEKRYNAVFMKFVDKGLREAEIKVSDIDVFASTLGPGAFTGVRISMAAMKAFALALDKKFFGVSTLEILAFSAGVKEGRVTAVLDARRNEVYTAVFEVRDAKISLLGPGMELKKREAFLGQKIEGTVVFLKRDAFFVEYLRKSSKIDVVLKEHIEMSAFCGILMDAAKDIKKEAAYSAAPVYIRKPDAEKAQEKGIL